ncbi:chromatin associated protein KTI12 [Podospora australis]|uniref:Chromatin associated protein KTI12 n=1 Tax=Podospora australis TaxID=1536484 RepID=A0AAN7ANH4_9PEZI|nr:chromatin associated protein KTI12 [Podospora australis]
MPLIIITGLPTSGKSHRAAQLHAYLAERIASAPPSPQPYRLHLISDETQSVSRTVYDLDPEHLPAHVRSANASEKDARASLYAAVKRVLSPRDIVILDGLNYIKGWRYQLHCEAKNTRTSSCLLQIGCSVDRAREVNQARDDTDEKKYRDGNWENLVFRYEEPNPMTRWDSPLFTLIWEDDEAETRKVFDKIWEEIGPGENGRKKIIQPNKSTVQRDKDPGGDYLYVLEKETQDIVKRILERQNEVGEGGTVVIPRTNGAEGEENELEVELPGKKVGLPQLQRYRRAFVALNRGGIGLEAVGKLAAGRLRESFVGYLNDAFENDG